LACVWCRLKQYLLLSKSSTAVNEVVVRRVKKI
jgi:hypothetical protein